MLGVWARFFRVRLLPTALLNALTGAIAAGAIAAPPEGGDVALAGLLVATLYLVGMGLNDLVDRHRDRALSPDRPLPSGQLGVRSAAGAVLAAGLLAMAAATFLPPESRPWSAAILLAILAYDLALKDRAWLGPLAMGSVRALLVLFGASLAGGLREGLLPALVIGGHGFWTTRYSLEEEAARPGVLTSRSRGVLAHSVVSAGLVAAIVAPAPLLLVGWLAPVGFIALALRQRAAAAPGRFTLLCLCALPLLDGALQLSYDSPFTAAMCGLVHLASLPRPSRRADASPEPIRPPDDR
jgi:hypothetical protein